MNYVVASLAYGPRISLQGFTEEKIVFSLVLNPFVNIIVQRSNVVFKLFIEESLKLIIYAPNL